MACYSHCKADELGTQEQGEEMKIIQAKDIQVEVTPITTNPHWDYQISVTHPMVATSCLLMVSGGAPIVDAAVSRCTREMKELIACLA